ncbi:MAG TPA: LAGLIDADG family homing endonuclease [Usitatibacter sp.]|nr:LAGLIDADG family homing endonuclease [Usitatibacter sp.]
MRLSSDIHPAAPLANPVVGEERGSAQERYADYKIIRRNGAVVAFEPDKISVAMTKAFLAVGGNTAAASAGMRDKVQALTEAVVAALMRRHPAGGTFHIEDVQDQVELAMMRAGEHQVARSYVLYREERARERAKRIQEAAESQRPRIHVTVGGARVPLDTARLEALIASACEGLGGEVEPAKILEATLRDLYDGVPLEEVHKCAILAARMLIERDPDYTYVTARLLLHTIRREVLGEEVTHAQMSTRYAEYFPTFVHQGVKAQLLDERLASFDLKRLGAAMKPERDLQFTYLGLQTLYDRYFLHVSDRRIELPQAFFMRVAMGLALNEIDREARAIQFYDVLSTFDFMSSTPTLFNSGTQRSQLSSCYLTTVADDLDGIYEAIKENALLSKFAGGLGNDWTPVRALGSYIKGTNGKSQGVVPFLKVVSDTAVAVNQCFAPHTGVYTADGLKAIKDVEPGDLVLGRSGTYREVERRYAYNQTARMVSVKVKHAIEPLLVTAGHPFYAIRGVPMEQSNARTHAWIAKGKMKAQWVDAGELRRGDYVAQVVPTEVVNVPGLSEDDARMYGILLGDGHLSKDGMQWGVSGNPARDEHLAFVRAYLRERGIHFWETGRGETYAQVHWAFGRGAVRDATTGRIAGAGEATMPFGHGDLYDEEGRKHVARRFSHLPRPHALAMIRGLLETDGGVSRGKEIYFTNASKPLVDGLRYQLLRMGVPTAGQYRERENGHQGVRSDGSTARFEGTTRAWDLRIPAVPEIAALVGCRPIAKRNWIELEGKLFSRVTDVHDIAPKPFVYDLKVEGDESYMTTGGLAHNGGKRKGAVCCYLETWHLDIEEFLELRKNTGDDRRRTHDMNTANWIPDLFMKRVMEGGEWTLFSPSDVPDLHDKFGRAFEEAYVEYERRAARGELKLHKKIPAQSLWRKMLTMLFETGHPWITFKDAANVRSPQQHVGVVHSSNLCCIAADQRVVTDRGMLTIGELYRLGGKNKVVGLDGVYDASEMLLPRPDAPMVRIETEEGYSHKVTPDHKVWVKDRGWVEAQHLVAGDKLLVQQLEGLWGPDHMPELSYLMGLVAGDGTFGRGSVHVDVWEQEFDMLAKTTETVHFLLEGNTVLRTTSTNTPEFAIDWKAGKARLSSAPLRRLFEEHGFTRENKTRVPRLVWEGDRETVSAYLRGLYQADGNVVASGEATTLALASTDRALIEELQVLWANFGVKSSINQMRGHEEHALPDGKGGRKSYWSQPLYRLLVTSIRGCRIAEEVTGLAASRKSESSRRYLENLKKDGYEQKLHATFTGLTPLPNEDAYCLAVDSDTHAWTVNGLVTKNTEITLNTNAEEIAVCNLGSVNLRAHVRDGKLDHAKLKKTIATAMRMLDNVIDINYYAVKKARDSNARHRPVGLGIMGFQDCLQELRIPYASEAAVEFADRSMEAVCYYAYWASTELAAERGRYSTFGGSLWDRGILPQDTLKLLLQERGGYVDVDLSESMDWPKLRERIKVHGMRNSNCVAIAPTATISNIVGVSASIEPNYQNLFVKSNLSGEFTVVNESLVRDLKKLALWDPVMVNDLKHFDGSIGRIDRVPPELRSLYATAFEVEPKWLVEAGARRQKWIDQAQSLNIYMAGASGKKLDECYKLAWVRGLKTTYYLRTLAATSAEKSTGKGGELNAVPAGGGLGGAAGARPAALEGAGEGASDGAKFCSIDNPDCEACQ